jgi:hypothetical protein
MAANGQIGTAADLGYRLAGGFGIEENSRAEHEAFQGQVYRALEQLVAEEFLVRNYGDHGHYVEPCYRTAEEEVRRLESERLATEAALELRVAWDMTHDRIRKLGIDGKMAGPVISLDLDSWAQLLLYAERGYV